MTIVYLHQYFLTPEMSGGTRSYEMARRFVRAGHDVHMITTDQKPSPDAGVWRDTVESGIRVHWANVPYSNHMGFAKRIQAFFAYALRAAWLAARLDADVILATSTPLTVAIPAILASRMRRVPFVFEVRDMWPDVPVAIGAIRNPLAIRAARWLELTAYRRAAHVVALAPGMRDDIILKGIPAAKVSVVPNGCDLDVFSRPATNGPAPASPRDAHVWLAERKLVVFAGTFGLVNGVEYFAKLAADVARIDPEYRFVTIGGGREEARVRQVAADAGILDRSFFMFPSMPKRELVPWLHAADLVVALFAGPAAVWKDAVQNKFFDALASGTPIASNFDGWQSRVAVDASVGFTLPPTDTVAAARQIVAALSDTAWRAGLRDRARQLAEGPFNREHLAASMLDILTRAASTGH